MGTYGSQTGNVFRSSDADAVAVAGAATGAVAVAGAAAVAVAVVVAVVVADAGNGSLHHVAVRDSGNVRRWHNPSEPV